MKIFKSFLEILNHPNNKNNQFNALLRLFWWKVNQIFFNIPAIIEIIPNVKCICYPKSSFGSLIVYTKLPEYLEMNFLKKYLSDKSVFIDVGAGIGDYSLIAASKIKKGKIISFEPVQESYDKFLENIKINNFTKKIKLIKSVVSNKNGYINFSAEEISEISHITPNKKNGVKKKSLTLDFIIEKNKISIVDLIKVDVEGAESLVLDGLSDSFIRNKIKVIILELNHNSKSFETSSQKNFQTLKKNKFVCFKIKSNKLVKILNKTQISNEKTENILCFHKTIMKNKEIKDIINNET